MVVLALLLAVAAMVVFGWGHRWSAVGGRHVALGLILLTAAWIVQTVFVGGTTVTVH